MHMGTGGLTMAEYIERGALDKALTVAAANGKDKDRRTWAKAICVLHDAPAADVAPIRHGHWIRVSLIGVFECSECSNQITVTDSKFAKEVCRWCLHCGARMDGGANAVEVVRCKDCEYSCDINDLCCSCGVFIDCEVSPNFYCAEGKRKEDE